MLAKRKPTIFDIFFVKNRITRCQARIESFERDQIISLCQNTDGEIPHGKQNQLLSIHYCVCIFGTM